MLLPPAHAFTELVVRECHLNVMHSGAQDIMTEIGEKSWNMSFEHLMVVYEREYEQLMHWQHWFPRTEPRQVEVAGIDFAGPLFTKGKRNGEKAYIMLFTFAATGAIHLELVSDLSEEKFQLALRRFIARRGLLWIIYTDNALTFKKTSKDLLQLFNSIKKGQFTSYCAERQIHWKYIVEKAAWWGRLLGAFGEKRQSMS